MTGQARSTPLLRFRSELDRYAIFAATAAFTLLTAGWATGGVEIPGGLPVLACFPVALLAIDQLFPHSVVGRELRGCAAWSVLLLGAFEAVPTLTSSTLNAIALPGAIAMGLAVARFPAAATVSIALVSAIVGTVQAYTGVAPFFLVDVVLAGIWLTLVARLALGRPYEFVVWPAMACAVLFVAVSLGNLVLADQTSVAWIGFRTSVWYMLAFIALAYIGWPREVYRRIALGLVGLTVLITGYALLREVIGPSEAERSLAEETSNRINVDPIDKHLRTVGSFLTGHQLAFWSALMAPFCAALGLWLSGRWRLVAFVAAGMALMAIFVSEARGPLPGLVAGMAAMLAIYQVSRAFRGFKAGLVVSGLIATAVAATAIAAWSSSDPEGFDRYARIIDPESETSYVQRQLKWEQVINEIGKQPFGHGLGTGGAGQANAGTSVALVSTVNIDSTYLMVAYEQGVIVLVIFVVMAVGLVVSLAIAAARTRSREAAAIGMGACGTLISMLVSFYSGIYIEALPVVTGWIVLGLGLSYLVARDAESH